MDELKKDIYKENISMPQSESMDEEEYKKDADIQSQVFASNSTINSTKMTILNAIKSELISLKAEIDLTRYVAYIPNSRVGMNYYFDTLYEYPELFYPDLTVRCTYYTNSSGKITRFYLKISYISSAAAINIMKNNLNAVVNKIRDYYLYNASGNLEKEYIIHDYLLENCTYDTSQNLQAISHTSYAALVSGRAVCDGYSKAAKLLFNLCNIDAGIITSDSMNHAWNYVKMNGYYYFIDITWDDPVPETFISRYSYFNRNSQEMINGNHTWISSNYPDSTSNLFSFLRNYNKLTRSNDKLYYYDAAAKTLYSMTLEGKSKTAVRTSFYYSNSLELIGYNNNLYYVKSIYYSDDKKTYNAIVKYNLTTKLETVIFKTLGNIKKIYKKNFNIIVQYAAAQSNSSISTTTISVEMK